MENEVTLLWQSLFSQGRGDFLRAVDTHVSPRFPSSLQMNICIQRSSPSLRADCSSSHGGIILWLVRVLIRLLRWLDDQPNCYFVRMLLPKRVRYFTQPDDTAASF